MKEITVKKMNRMLLYKLVSAYFSGVRLTKITDEMAQATVRYHWRSQNPFKSIYFGVQAMAAELSTGVLVMKQIAKNKKKVSMLVIHQTGSFHKKAVGKITFTCKNSDIIANALEKSIETKEGQVFQLISEGYDEQGDKVSTFMFEWSILVKS